MIEIESVSRHVADLASATAFYEALGFTPDSGGATDWAADSQQLCCVTPVGWNGANLH